MRTIRVETGDADGLAAAQPERRRRFDQLRPGPFRAELTEVAWGAAALQAERWSCGMRVRSERPSGYLTFAILAPEADTRWCGAEVRRGTVVRIEDPWELSSAGALRLVAFAVDRTRLDRVVERLAGGEQDRARIGNRSRQVPHAARLAEGLARLLARLGSTPLPAAALEAAEADLFQLAAALERGSETALPRRPAAPSRRRAAVRRIEEYLDANRGATPSIPTLCAVAEVSERTLEYATREHLGMTPVRFLKLRRLNGIRRELLDPENQAAGVTEVAHRAGIYDLGRFAGEYRRLFGELPSHTLRRAKRAVRR